VPAVIERVADGPDRGSDLFRTRCSVNRIEAH